jgi:hypothetical protein
MLIRRRKEVCCERRRRDPALEDSGNSCFEEIRRSTHEFEPGIPRWPGFPDETRKTIYWYDKRPDTIGSGFFGSLETYIPSTTHYQIER